MTDTLRIRPAVTEDLAAVLDLYLHLTPNNVPFDLQAAADIFATFSRYPGSAILLGHTKKALITSCTVVVVPNLTRGGKPYALVENVVTRADQRGKGFGKAMLNAATEQAWANDCYKIMLMTGAQDPAVLGFYEAAGFQQSKTGFQKRRKAL